MVHFLLHALDPASTKQAPSETNCFVAPCIRYDGPLSDTLTVAAWGRQIFRDCWPVYEEKERMRDFQALAFSTLERLQQDEANCIPNGVFRKTTLGEHGERHRTAA